MIVRSLCLFALLVSGCFLGCSYTIASLQSVSAQEVQQGGSGTGTEGDAAEAEEAYKLGMLLSKGGDHAGAFEWFASAAERRHVEATYMQARAYAEGHGVARDDKLAVPLFQIAVKEGHTGAMSGLGLMHFAGRGGLQKSVGKAEELFRRAAQRGNAQAMYNLGNLYARGSQDRKPDLAMAYVLLELANQNGIKEAQTLKQSVEGKLSLAQRTEVDALRTQWKNSLKANK